ncbi:MAG TPA: ABC transporter ATP-binding protein [Thermosulfidibacter takaii]|uniref:ABC transporter ATP-binding protein n=1 Tax=Thermosulfidibacter takaii TaxID=412593 RepID=A0A7C0U722_9BACT|nr:ABC transporter ATP-binding protein [Thermosulfidibacter takaii]
MILQTEDVTKTFGGLVALSDVTFQVEEGEILGIIGPNGAGKTTLFNAISGVFKIDKGRVKFKGKDITSLPPNARARLGIARTHQIVKPLNDLTVVENVMVGACFGKGNASLPEARKKAQEVLEFVGLAEKGEILAGKLNVPEKKRLEMARALASDPDVILLDEVLAGLNPMELSSMLEVIKAIREKGITILMIEHLMHAIMNVSDRVMALVYGRKISEGTPEEVANDPQVVEAYLGDPDLALKLLKDKRRSG